VLHLISFAICLPSRSVLCVVYLLTHWIAAKCISRRMPFIGCRQTLTQK
jgi:hypothetical protein